jgi:hypothetical protein
MNDKIKKVIIILRDFEADGPGADDITKYVENRCHVLNIPEFKQIILSLINKATTGESCKL